MEVIKNLGQLNFVNELDYQFHNFDNQFFNCRTGSLIVPVDTVPCFNVLIDAHVSELKLFAYNLTTGEDTAITTGITTTDDAYVINQETGEIEPYISQSTPYYSEPLDSILSTGTGVISPELDPGYYYLKLIDEESEGVFSIIYSNIFKFVS